MSTRITALIAAMVTGFCLACGKSLKQDMKLSGTVVLSAAGEVTGPLFLELLAANDYDSIENDPPGSIIKVINIREGAIPARTFFQLTVVMSGGTAPGRGSSFLHLQR